MTKGECGMSVVIVILVGIITGMACWAYQQKVNENLMYAKFEKEILLLQEKNDSQDRMIGSVIRTQAMLGAFDFDRVEASR